MKPALRLPLLLLAILALLVAMWAGLLRIGWTLPTWQPRLAQSHGPLMIGGFLGTLIALERVVSLNRRAAYIIPGVAAAGALALMVGIIGWGSWLITLGSLGLAALFLVMLRQHPALHTGVMAGAAWLWFVGNVIWLLGRPIHQAVLWWASFLILTIAGERLELSRILRPPRRARQLFLGALLLVLIGLVLSVGVYDAGIRLTSIGFLALAAWLLRYDLARRTVRQHGLPRFIAICLLSGYAWLGVGSLLALIFGGMPAGVYYDAILHAWFLGFVFAMIFGHAPIIFPAILERPITYHVRFYLPLVLLHLSLLLRLIGDLTLSPLARRWGGLLNVAVLLLFLLNTAISLRQPTPARA